MTLTLVYPIGQQQAATARILTESYAKIGITLKARGMELESLRGSTCLQARPSCTSRGWIADYPSMDNFLYPVFESGSSPDSMGTCYSNPEVDAILAKARATTDQRARIQRYAEAERLVLADAPAIPLSVFADARLLNSRVANVRFDSMGWVDLWRAWVR